VSESHSEPPERSGELGSVQEELTSGRSGGWESPPRGKRSMEARSTAECDKHSPERTGELGSVLEEFTSGRTGG
jgi:hypothetical protein